MKTTEFLEKQISESAKIRAELDKHLTTKKQVDDEYKTVDFQCIKLAERLLPFREAWSPEALEVESTLRSRRFAKDAILSRFMNRKQELERQLETFTRQPIAEFIEESLGRMKNLGRAYKYQILEHSRDPLTEKSTFRVKHNWAGINAAREKILAGIKEIRKLNHHPLAELLGTIERFRREFDGLDATAFDVEEVDAVKDSLMRPTREPENFQKATLAPSGKVILHEQPSDPAVKDLANRITKLEKIK